MNLRPALLMTFVLAGVIPAAAQSDFVGKDRFPQFRGFGGLPGNGFGVTPDGAPSFRGAMSFSTPVAYSLTDWRFVIGMSVIGTENRFSFRLDGESDKVNDTGNGSGQILLGIPLGRYGSLTAGSMVPSSQFDEVYNFHYSPPNQQGPVRYALGVQDLAANGGSSGTGVEGDEASSTSWYGVATWQSEDEKLYASAGWGTRRFRQGFANVSYNFDSRFKAVAEYDTFGVNVMVAARLYSGPVVENSFFSHERQFEITTSIGLARGKYPFWAINFSF
jgi:hypothetical protein